jgi:hypothetical protein
MRPNIPRISFFQPDEYLLAENQEVLALMQMSAENIDGVSVVGYTEEGDLAEKAAIIYARYVWKHNGPPDTNPSSVTLKESEAGKKAQKTIENGGFVVRLFLNGNRSSRQSRHTRFHHILKSLESVYWLEKEMLEQESASISA